MGAKGRIAGVGQQFPAPAVAPQPKRIERLLASVERIGNKIPHPAVIFVLLIVLLVLLSHLLYLAGVSATHESINPTTHLPETVTSRVESLLTPAGIRFMYSGVIPNFMGFTAVGVIIVAMIGVGVAEASGFVAALMYKLVGVAPGWAMTYILVFVGILSSIASDAGYLVLIPLSGAAFLSLGRNPLAGLAASFAAVSAVFSVNILIKPIDGILTDITNDAIHLVDPSRSIAITANFWFSLASVLLLTVVCGLITDRIISPRLGPYHASTEMQVELQSEVGPEVSPADQSRGLRFASVGLVVVLLLFGALTISSHAPLRNPETGALLGDSPFMNGLIVCIAISFLVMGVAYARGARTMSGASEIIHAMEKAIASLAPLLFLLFFVAQFIALFSYTNVGTIAAVKLGDTLQHLGLGAIPLLIGFVILGGLTNFLIAGVIPRWAILAPVFVPLLMKLGLAPDAILAAYRVGDSPLNIISPVMSYMPLMIGFAERYKKDVGLGTIIAMMLPYALVLQVVWTLLLVAWYTLGLPWGF